MGKTLAAVFLACIITYFAWKGAQSIDHFQSVTWHNTLHNGDGFREIVWFLFSCMEGAIVICTILVFADAILDDNYSPEFGDKSAFILSVLWAITGWYAGNNLSKDDPTLLPHICFSFVTISLMIVLIIRIPMQIRNYASSKTRDG